MPTPKFRESRIDFSKFLFDKYDDFHYINGIYQSDLLTTTLLSCNDSYYQYLKTYNSLEDFWKKVKEQRKMIKIEIPATDKFITLKRWPTKTSGIINIKVFFSEKHLRNELNRLVIQRIHAS